MFLQRHYHFDIDNGATPLPTPGRNITVMGGACVSFCGSSAPTGLDAADAALTALLSPSTNFNRHTPSVSKTCTNVCDDQVFLSTSDPMPLQYESKSWPFGWHLQKVATCCHVCCTKRILPQLPPLQARPLPSAAHRPISTSAAAEIPTSPSLFGGPAFMNLVGRFHPTAVFTPHAAHCMA